MPISDNITVPYVSAIVRSLHPSSALDVGVGMGKFGFILREQCDWSVPMTHPGTSAKVVQRQYWRTRLDGIEICEAYITPLQHYLYDQILVGPAQEVSKTLGAYDLIHLGDVLEHLDRAEGLRLVDLLFQKARMGVLVVTPIGELEQSGLVDNPYEEHRSVWSPKDFADFPCVWSRRVSGKQWVIFLSREPHWFADPTSRRKSQKGSARSATFRRGVKLAIRWCLGPKWLTFLIGAKRWMKGWRRKH